MEPVRVIMVFSVVFSLILSECNAKNIKSISYERTVDQWSSHEDVAKWLKSNFSWSRDSQIKIQKGIRKYRYEDV